MNVVEIQELLVGTQQDYVKNLEKAIEKIKQEIDEAAGKETADHPEWQQAIGGYIDELHKMVFSLSEPRYGSEEDHQKIIEIRNKVKELYAYMKNKAGA